jgi:hypothetical protein
MGFFKDKNRIYFHYDMSDGGYFQIWSEDVADFEMIGNYVRYKGKIYYPRFGYLDADYESFKTSNSLGPLGKDKNGFFEYGEKKSLEEIKDNFSVDMVNKLLSL